MNYLSQKELLEVEGGGFKAVLGIIGIAIVFGIGIIDGYLRPLKCR